MLGGRRGCGHTSFGATSTARVTFGAPVSATRGTRVPRLRPRSARRTPGSPTSIHIGRGAPRQGAPCWPDLLSRREWHAPDLYWEVCRALDGEYELELWLATPDGIAGGFGFDSLERDFSERDKLVLDTLQPHLVQLWRNAAASTEVEVARSAHSPGARDSSLGGAREVEPRDRRPPLSRAGNDPQTQLVRAEVMSAIDEQVAAVVLFWGDPTPYVEAAHERGAKLLVQVGSVVEAEAAAAAGFDAVIAQGVEAGGHVRGTTSIWELLPVVVAAVSPLSVLASGGIGDGTGVA